MAEKIVEPQHHPARGREFPSLNFGQSAPDKPLVEQNTDGSVTLNFHEGQHRTWGADARIVAMIAGSQGGKTSFGSWWLYREILEHGEGDYIAATASYDLFKLKMLPEIRNVFENILQIGRYWAADRILEIKDPATGEFRAKHADDPMYARIILRSAEAKGGLESSSAKAAWLDEAGQDKFTLSAFEAVRRRLTLNRGRILISTTPYNLGWLKQQIADRDGKGVKVVNFDSVANPAFSQEEFDELKEIMPAWKFNMFHRGLFERPPGQIYVDFKDEYREKGGHKVKPFPIPQHWLRYVGVDPGVINTCKVWLAQDPDTFAYYLYRESLGERKGMPEHAKDAAQIAHENKEYVVKWAVGAKSEIYHQEDWQNEVTGAVVAPAHSDVESRIDGVIAVLRQFRLFVFDTCTGTLDQFGTYAREVDDNGDVTEKIKDKEKFHYMDALGYIVEHLDFFDTTIGAVIHDQRQISQSAY
jgi:hypothetical protein